MAKAKPSSRIESSRLNTPTDLDPNDVKKIAEGLTVLSADLFALYIKTKNFHWHVSGPNFRDYHLLMDEQAAQIFAIIDSVGERARKVGGTVLRSIGQAKSLTRVPDNDADYVSPLDMLKELRDDNKALTAHMRELHAVTDEANDVATTSQLEEWIDQSEERTWFLYEATRDATEGGH
ncbi:Dps family protein [Methylobacterium sp. NEAU K]|uniref:Dps family protein n=1 Tax=Methylobacterium sp. NEAU K TaxID=3064946 RepID=UPI00273445BD|nr:DNA starvation/stationary phase protection protein [Methylobacterium sp. NEAU K]MDP4004595.1 DNA starvation/stationary phase protection protein [Methylobacterium sp. NEAU K]